MSGGGGRGEVAQTTLGVIATVSSPVLRSVFGVTSKFKVAPWPMAPAASVTILRPCGSTVKVRFSPSLSLPSFHAFTVSTAAPDSGGETSRSMRLGASAGTRMRFGSSPVSVRPVVSTARLNSAS